MRRDVESVLRRAESECERRRQQSIADIGHAAAAGGPRAGAAHCCNGNSLVRRFATRIDVMNVDIASDRKLPITRLDIERPRCRRRQDSGKRRAPPECRTVAVLHLAPFMPMISLLIRMKIRVGYFPKHGFLGKSEQTTCHRAPNAPPRRPGALASGSRPIFARHMSPAAACRAALTPHVVSSQHSKRAATTLPVIAEPRPLSQRVRIATL